MRRTGWIRPAAAWVVLMAAGGTCAADGFFSAGQPVPKERDFNLQVMGGSVVAIKGMVEETTRPFYNVTGQPELNAENASTYHLDDFDLTGGYGTVGLSMEKMWKWFTLEFDAAMMKPSVSSVAKADYYIGVGNDIPYQGKTYAYMKIPQGTPFSAELEGGFLELRGQFTPVTMHPFSGLSLTPGLDLGLFGFLADYTIDAGPSTGVTSYEDPPKDYVVGGTGKGLVGLAVPEAGLAGTVRIGPPDGVNLVMHGHYSMFHYSGSSRFFTSADDYEKNIDADHSDYRLELDLEIPLKSGRAITIGGQYERVHTTASIKSAATTPEEIIARREKFDKYAEFEMILVSGKIGMTF